MAQENKVTQAPTKIPNSNFSIEELRDWYNQNQKTIELFAKTNNAIKNLRDVTKSSSKSITNFSKDKLRNYFKNISSNENNLRNLSIYLYYRSQIYYRLIKYNSNMFCLDARSVIPQFDPLGDIDKDKILKSYYDTLNILNKMNLQYEFLKIYTICFREDVFYGCVYFDEKAKNAGNSFFVLPLPAEYCKISGTYQTGDFAFSMNMTYFQQRQELIEYWGSPFKEMWNEYQKDTTNGKWQLVPDKYAICLKARPEDWDLVVPVFSGLLNAIISLLDQEDIQAVADEQQIYKLITATIPLLKNSDSPDDWAVDIDTSIDYYNKLCDSLPNYIGAAITPIPLDVLTFGDDQTTDVNKVQNATKTVLNTAGGAQILNSATISGTTSVMAALKADTEFAISMLLPQTEAWVNRFMSYYVTNPSKVKFHEISVYTKKEFRDALLEDDQYGLSSKLAVGTLNGFSELDTILLNILENDLLGINFTPVQSTHTTSNKDSGGQTKSETELTDDGEASIDKRDNA